LLPRSTLSPYTTLFRSYGPLTDEQREQFLVEEEEYQRQVQDQLAREVEDLTPVPVRTAKETLQLVVSISKQRLTVLLHGKPVRGDRKSTRVNSSHVKIS